MNDNSLVADMALKVLLTTELIVKNANNALGEVQEIKNITGAKREKTWHD